MFYSLGGAFIAPRNCGLPSLRVHGHGWPLLCRPTVRVALRIDSCVGLSISRNDSCEAEWPLQPGFVLHQRLCPSEWRTCFPLGRQRLSRSVSLGDGGARPCLLAGQRCWRWSPCACRKSRTPLSSTVAGFVRRSETELLLWGFASSPVVQVSGRVVLTLAPVHLNRAGMVGRIGDALFFAIEFPLLCIHDAMDCGLFGFAHGEGGLQSSF